MKSQLKSSAGVESRVVALLRREIELASRAARASTLTPICRHWSIRNTPTGVYGIATLRLVSVNVRFGTPASCRSFFACAREALMSFEKPG